MDGAAVVHGTAGGGTAGGGTAAPGGAPGGPFRLLLPEGHEPRVREAAVRLARGGAVHPVVVLGGGAVAGAAAAGAASGGGAAGADAETVLRGLAAQGRCTLWAASAPVPAAHVDAYAARRGVPARVAARMLARPAFRAAAALAAGEADGLLAGVAGTTAEMVTACEAVLGLEPGAQEVTSTFLLRMPDGRRLVLADCAVVPQPSAEQLARIALAAARAAARLPGFEVRVAMLSFSSRGSAEHPDAAKVREATALVRAAAPGLAVDGELQADTALDPRIAAAKLGGGVGGLGSVGGASVGGPGQGDGGGLGPVAGRATVLVFPDLDAGNIGYKLLQVLGGASSLGAFLHGFGVPVCDASRGATVDDVVGSAEVLAQLAGVGAGAGAEVGTVPG